MNKGSSEDPASIKGLHDLRNFGAPDGIATISRALAEEGAALVAAICAENAASLATMHPLFDAILQAHGAPEPRKPNIKTHYDPPPIPTRDCDWSAFDDNTYDGPGCPIGWGRTEQEAIDDLLEKLLTTISRAVEPHLTELGAFGISGA